MPGPLVQPLQAGLHIHSPAPGSPAAGAGKVHRREFQPPNPAERQQAPSRDGGVLPPPVRQAPHKRIPAPTTPRPGPSHSSPPHSRNPAHTRLPHHASRITRHSSYLITYRRVTRNSSRPITMPTLITRHPARSLSLSDPSLSCVEGDDSTPGAPSCRVRPPCPRRTNGKARAASFPSGSSPSSCQEGTGIYVPIQKNNSSLPFPPKTANIPPTTGEPAVHQSIPIDICQVPSDRNGSSSSELGHAPCSS